MKLELKSLRGMKDIFSIQHSLYNHIVNTSFTIAENYGFEYISTPVLEYTEIFSRVLGTSSDIVSKEMYTFLDKNGDSVTLRPEFTAGIMRSIIVNKLYNNLPLRLFSVGPLFRYNRPQAGRYRQFHQINFEYVGVFNPYNDAELISCANSILNSLGILDKTTLEINSLGCPISRSNYQNQLNIYFSNYFNELSNDSKKLLEQKKTLRILDSKDEHDIKICSSAPLISSFYTDESKKYFEQLISYLDSLGIKYKINTKLVRGLDYYSHTIFEYKTTELGTQDSVIGGGRYDELSEIMGGPKLPAIGFSIGVERIMLLMENIFCLPKKRPLFIINIGEENIPYSLQLANKFRNNNIITIIAIDGKIDKKLHTANKCNAKYAIFVGGREVQSEIYTVKNLDQGIEYKQSLQEILALHSDV